MLRRTIAYPGDQPTFDLFFTSGPLVDSDGWRYALGRIVIGIFEEAFEADLGSWTLADYESQWKHAATRLADGEQRTAFFTSYLGIESAYHSWWPAWRERDIVRVQHHLLLQDQLRGPFDIGQPYGHIRDRQSIGDQGKPISEWVVGIEHVLAFASRPTR